jgi:methylaspartate mutase sigma subunit
MSRKVIIAVAKSDAHVVANRMIHMMLLQEGFFVINLGVCTSIEEIAESYRQHPDVAAILIGSLNGHASVDLFPLKQARLKGLINCPVVLGGNLSVGKQKDASMKDYFHQPCAFL